MKNNYLSSIIIGILIVSSLWAGTEGTIRGAVRNVEGEPLIGAQVYIEALGIGNVANMDEIIFLLMFQLGLMMLEPQC